MLGEISTKQQEKAAEVIAAYARQIIEVARDSETACEHRVTKLLKEFGAKSYRAGKRELAARVASCLQEELRGVMARPAARTWSEDASEFGPS